MGSVEGMYGSRTEMNDTTPFNPILVHFEMDA